MITARKGTELSQLWEQPSTEHHLQQVLLPPATLNKFRETAFHTTVNLTLISKAEVKIFATKMSFLTKELSSWAYIQSKNSESS